jgi:predicted DCC family thiol-disulfide oxidoreductase YuxK
MSELAHIEVFTDGQCPLCQWMRARVEPFDRRQRIHWLDYRDPEVQQRAAPYTLQELDAEMHARTPDGRWSAGYGAWIAIMRVLPGWRYFAPLLSIWPLTSLGALLYRWLARRRYKLFGVPPPCDASGVCALHAPK